MTLLDFSAAEHPHHGWAVGGCCGDCQMISVGVDNGEEDTLCMNGGQQVIVDSEEGKKAATFMRMNYDLRKSTQFYTITD